MYSNGEITMSYKLISKPLNFIARFKATTKLNSLMEPFRRLIAVVDRNVHILCFVSASVLRKLFLVEGNTHLSIETCRSMEFNLIESTLLM